MSDNNRNNDCWGLSSQTRIRVEVTPEGGKGTVTTYDNADDARAALAELRTRAIRNIHAADGITVVGFNYTGGRAVTSLVEYLPLLSPTDLWA